MMSPSSPPCGQTQGLNSQQVMKHKVKILYIKIAMGNKMHSIGQGYMSLSHIAPYTHNETIN